MQRLQRLQRHDGSEYDHGPIHSGPPLRSAYPLFDTAAMSDKDSAADSGVDEPADAVRVSTVPPAQMVRIGGSVGPGVRVTHRGGVTIKRVAGGDDAFGDFARVPRAVLTEVWETLHDRERTPMEARLAVLDLLRPWAQPPE